MQGRVQLLLLAFALVDAAGALVVVVAFGAQPLVLYLAGLAAPVALAAVWLSTYRRGTYDVVADVVTVGAVCVITMAVPDRWFYAVMALLMAAVFFGAAYGSLPRVLLRTGLISAVALGQGISDQASLTPAVVLVVAFVVIACLMHAMATFVERYEQTARRERILAAIGLDLVAACDLPAIVASAVEGAGALCADLPGIRVSLAMVEGSDRPPLKLRVLRSSGQRSGAMEKAVVEVRRLTVAGHELADQRLLRSGDEARHGADEDRIDEPAFLPGEMLVTRISVEGSVRGALLIESPGPISEGLPGGIHALATQVSLAISRLDLQSVLATRESAERFQALVQSSSDVIAITSAEGSVTYLSPSARQILGWEPDEVLGSPVSSLVHPDDRGGVMLALARVVVEAGSSRTVECRVRHSDGSWRHTETRMTNRLDVPEVGGIVFNTSDITDHHNLVAELRHQAFHDPLTGLANRVLFSSMIEEALVAARRDGGMVAVLYCDLDGMKRVNDSLGSSVGETALTAVAGRLRGCVRKPDAVSRLGGYEFGILLDRLVTPVDATMAMERIMDALRQPFQLVGAQVDVQPQIGVAVSISGEESAEDLLSNAAVAMRQARVFEGGYALFDPEMHAEAIRRIEVETELRTAIDEHQFTLHYQPTIDLRNDRLTGVEALVRWQHPRRGLVAPMEFIPLAEETGLIIPLGVWTIREACRQIRKWQQDFPVDEPITLSVNLSPRQLHHPNLVRDVSDALEDSGLAPSRLVLELTENVLMTDTAATLSRLFQLKSLGVRLAVDDFGTGYSSFAYLRRFPVDIIKIDKSFVDGIATEPTAAALVDAMIRIAKALNLETVAEGVERAEQADRLRVLQCDIGQGYLFSRPLPSEAMTALLREGTVGGSSRADAA
jgi:diguanylate cyclase (GGDEF)-like protein/PAS domain S-box-containing protein